MIILSSKLVSENWGTWKDPCSYKGEGGAQRGRCEALRLWKDGLCQFEIQGVFIHGKWNEEVTARGGRCPAAKKGAGSWSRVTWCTHHIPRHSGVSESLWRTWPMWPGHQVTLVIYCAKKATSTKRKPFYSESVFASLLGLRTLSAEGSSTASLTVTGALSTCASSLDPPL